MTLVVPAALGGLAILLMAVFTMVGARRRHRATIAPAAIVGPNVLVHDINDDRCTGCDACVAVCPTNVLDLVSNKSRVLRFEDCIQCEACMVACPTEALVMFPEGGTPPPLKCPEIDDNFQTIVPGQYLIGEVAGKPLVKNAANLGRAVVEHMLTTGVRPGAIGRDEFTVDVVIVGSGPGGLSAALTCVQKGLSYVVLDKEQQIASTIARYPKGKLVMAEPYDTTNLSLLPVFDSTKEALIPIWNELLERTGVRIKLGESVETVTLSSLNIFETRTTVSTYRSQRVVLSIGTRGKPRTLQVPGENLPKVFSLLEDPADWQGKAVLVVGGGDSAVEAALALADAGARVIISYRGKGFNRAAPKNKSAIEAYAAEGRLKAKLGSQVLGFDGESVTLALAEGTQKKYPNDGAFVLIGADPPVAWLEKMGVKFVERPHQYQMGRTDEIVKRYVRNAIECPEDAARAAAQTMGGPIGPPPQKQQPQRQPTAGHSVAQGMPMGMPEPVSGPRKWLRSATSIFQNKLGTNPGGMQSVPPKTGRTDLPGVGTNNEANTDRQQSENDFGFMQQPQQAAPPAPDPRDKKKKKLDAPVPLSEFARRQKSTVNPGHGNGRRDQLSAGERTRILRMLRDEGGRLADEDSQVYIGAAPPGPNDAFDFDDSPAPAPAPVYTSAQTNARTPLRAGDVPAKPAVVVGLAQAQANAKARSKRPTDSKRRGGTSARPAERPAPPPRRATSAPAFNDEPTRQVDESMLAALRAIPETTGTGPIAAPPPPVAAPVAAPARARYDEPTRMAAMPVNPNNDHLDVNDFLGDERTRLNDENGAPMHLGGHDEYAGDEKTQLGSMEQIIQQMEAQQQRPSRPAPKLPPPSRTPMPGSEERTRAVDIRNDKSISDVDWDLD